MSESLETLISTTQDALQPLIVKPKLTEKLLSKPPFRFLHDIFTSLLTATNFPAGLYSEFELDSANMKDKSQKLNFLDKMIMCVSVAQGKDLDVRSVKIVAGLEPENTNKFLQELAKVASDRSLHWNEAIQTVLRKCSSLDSGELSNNRDASGTGNASRAGIGDADKLQVSRSGKTSPVNPTPPLVSGSNASAEKKESIEPKRIESKEKKFRSEVAEKEHIKATPGDNDAVGTEMQQLLQDCNGDCEKTKTMIEAIISRPKMSVKLLSKAPFRFLHDTITEIMRTTGFATELYSPDELDSANIKDKQAKIDYLTKIIQYTATLLNTTIDAKPAKIVAGLEPDDTNRFLQLLAIACKLRDAGSAADTVGAQSTRSDSISKTRDKHQSVVAEATHARGEAVSKEKKSRKDADGEIKRDKTHAPQTGRFVSATSTSADDNNAVASAGSELTNEEDFAARGISTSGGVGTSRTSRPTTARRRPPKLKENATEIGRLTLHDSKLNPVKGIMKDGDNTDSDEDTLAADNNEGLSHTITLGIESELHGKLIQGILKDQKDEAAARKQKEDNPSNNSQENSETGIRLKKRTLAYKQKAKGATNAKEMDELRLNIQKICQAANPAGKCMELFEDDLSTMSKELEEWKLEFEKSKEKHEVEKKETAKVLQPLQSQLLEVEEQIKEQIEKINSVKSVVIKNDEHIRGLLELVVST